MEYNTREELKEKLISWCERHGFAVNIQACRIVDCYMCGNTMREAIDPCVWDDLDAILRSRLQESFPVPPFRNYLVGSYTIEEKEIVPFCCRKCQTAALNEGHIE